MSSINKKLSVRSGDKKTNQDEDEDIGRMRGTNKNRMISNDVCWCYHPCPHPDFLFDLRWSMGKSTWAVWKRLDAYLGKTVSRLNLSWNSSSFFDSSIQISDEIIKKYCLPCYFGRRVGECIHPLLDLGVREALRIKWENGGGMNSPVAKCPHLKGLCLPGRLKEITIKKEIIISSKNSVTCFSGGQMISSM